jgi:hypothetical protein
LEGWEAAAAEGCEAVCFEAATAEGAERAARGVDRLGGELAEEKEAV